ncbi:MAG: hypothetical protein ABR582_13265 [Gemmatimonadaceae bacterium]
MTIRFCAMISLAVVLGAAPAGAQGKQPEKVVFSPAVLKAMTAQKPKSKTPLSARLGIRRIPSSNISTAHASHAATTSVSQIKKIPAHR